MLTKSCVTNWKQKLITLLILLIVISGAMQLMITMQHENDLQDTYVIAAYHENNLRSKRNITYVSAKTTKTTKTTKRKRRKKRKKRKINSANKKDVGKVPLTRLDHENVKFQSDNDPTRFKQYKIDVAELNTELHLLKTENARLKQRDHHSNTTISNKNNQIEELKQQVKLVLSTTQANGVATKNLVKRISSNQTLQPHPAHRTHRTGKLTIVRNNLKAPDGSHNFKNWKHMNFDSCAVVGSGPSLLNSGYGVDIDNHDAVFRINSAPTKGFHQDVGSFTTFRVSYGITCLHALMTDEVPSNGICTAESTGKEYVLGAFNLMKKDIEIHERLYKRAWGNLLYNHTKIKSAKDLHMFYHLSGKAASYYGLEVYKATSGYNAILASLDLCNSIDLYGFDLGHSMSLNHMPKKAHYYDIYDTTYATKKEGQPHNFLNEWKRINQMTNTTEWVKKN